MVSEQIFISHASEDKHTIAVPLSDYLTERGISVWLDVNELTVGDSLRSAIDRGLSHARFGVIILSPDFIRKVWPNRELGALFSLERDINTKVILPIWHNVGYEEVISFSPMLADRLSISTSLGIPAVGEAVLRAILQVNAPAPRSVTRQYRDQAITGFHERLFTAKNPDELRRIVFEIKAYIERYPQDVEARMLLEKAREAYSREMSLLERPEPPYSPARRQSKFAPLALILLVLLLVLAIIFGFYLIHWLWH